VIDKIPQVAVATVVGSLLYVLITGHTFVTPAELQAQNEHLKNDLIVKFATQDDIREIKQLLLKVSSDVVDLKVAQAKGKH
jgi:hypothetical protein